jgi:hypothetical protein
MKKERDEKRKKKYIIKRGEAWQKAAHYCIG